MLGLKKQVEEAKQRAIRLQEESLRASKDARDAMDELTTAMLQLKSYQGTKRKSKRKYA